MPDAEAKLKVTIETAATGSGAPQAAAGLKDVAGAAGQAAPAMGELGSQSGKTAQELGRGIEVGNAATQAIQNLSGAAQGGAGGLISLARGAFGTGVAFKGMVAGLSGVGTLIAGAGIALGFITAAIRKSEESAAAAQKRLEALNQLKLDQAVKEQERLKQASADALTAIDAEYNSLQRLADAELALRKSAIDASDKSTEEKERLKLALDRQREDEKRAASLTKAQAEAEVLTKEEKRTAAASAAVTAEYQRQRDALQDLQAAKAKLAQTPEITSRYGIATANPEIDAARQRLAAAEAAAQGVSEGTRDQQKAVAEKADADARESARRADQARKAAALEGKTQTGENRRIQQTRSNVDAANRPKTEAEQAQTAAAQQQAAERADYQAGQYSPVVWANRIAAGMVDQTTIKALKKRYPKYKFPPSPAKSNPLTPPSVDEDTASTPSTPSTPGTLTDSAGRVRTATTATAAGGGTMVGPDGRVIQVPAVGQPAAGGGTVTIGGVTTTFPGAGATATAPTLTMGGQTYTGGAGGLKPAGQGSDKLAEQTQQLNQTMRETGKQAEEKLDLQPAVEGAEKVQQGQEAMREAIDQATQSQAEAMQAARQAQDQTVAKLGEVVSAQNSLRSDFAALERRVAAMNVA